MKVKKILLMILTAAVCLSCASVKKITRKTIDDDFSDAMKIIGGDRMNYLRLGEKQIGNTGFYYVLNLEGRVVFHPKVILIGKSFKGLWFIEPILNGKDGCINYIFTENRNYLFYKKINNNEILCLSIMEDEISDYIQGCDEIKR